MSLVKSIVSLLATVSVASAAAAVAGSPGCPIEKDVIVVGGGASGAHAAYRLREDYGKSVILIEKEAILVSFDQFH